MFKNNFKRTVARVGERIPLPPHRVKSYDLQSQTVTIQFEDGAERIVPLCFPSLEISKYGAEGYMSPEYLPYNHPGFIMDKTETNLVTHRRSGLKCQMALDVDFDICGSFALSPIRGSHDLNTMYYTSKKWDHHSLQSHLRDLQAKKDHTLNLKGTIYRILQTGTNKVMQSILVSKINLHEKFVIFLDFDGVVVPFKLSFFHNYFKIWED